MAKSNLRKFLATSVSAAVVASAVSPVAAEETIKFKDEKDFGSHKENIYKAVELGLVKGSNGSFMPKADISRGQVVKTLARHLQSVHKDIDTTNVTPFKDVQANHPDKELYEASLIVKKFGAFEGADGKLLPGNKITRQAMAKVLVNGFNLNDYEGEPSKVKDLDKAQEWARGYIKKLSELGITTQEEFRPMENVSRAQYASFLVRTVEGLEKPDTGEFQISDVSAADASTLKVTGDNLDLLKAEQFSLENNKVVSYTVNEEKTEATIKLEKAVPSGKEQILKFTEKAAEGQEAETVEFKFTYTLDVKSVQAASKRVDNDTDKQFVGLTINGGESVSPQYLKDNGYTVDFQSTTPNLFKEESTGELIKDLTGDFEYKVVVSKDGVAKESELAKVRVIDFDSYITTINETKLTQNGKAVKSGKLSVEDKTAKLSAVKATTVSGNVVTTPNVTYKSSNPAVAAVNASTGDITPVAPGNVTITVSAGDAVKEIPLTIATGARAADKATATATSVKLLQGKTQAIDLSVADQYGDDYNGSLTVTPKDAAVATAEAVTIEEGKGQLTVEALAKGTTSLEVKAGDKVLSTINVAVSDDAAVDTRKVETVAPSADTKLDVVAGSKDKTVDLVWNQYNAEGFLIGPETGFAGKYSVASSNDNVATAKAGEDGTIKVTAVKEGTANVVIKEGTVTRATVAINVANSTPEITGVTFEKPKDIITTGSFNEEVLKPENIKLSSPDYQAAIDEDGTIYADVDGTAGYNSEMDVTLGSLSAVFSGTADKITELKVAGGSVSGTATAGAEGTIVLKTTKADATVPSSTSTINVKVPN